MGRKSSGNFSTRERDVEKKNKVEEPIRVNSSFSVSGNRKFLEQNPATTEESDESV